jgi:hypothetical protein
MYPFEMVFFISRKSVKGDVGENSKCVAKVKGDRMSFEISDITAQRWWPKESWGSYFGSIVMVALGKCKH